MSNLPSWYDSWRTHDPASDEPEADICETCGSIMEWEDDVDVDEDTGRAYRCGGHWSCKNRNCGEDETLEEDNSKDK